MLKPSRNQLREIYHEIKLFLVAIYKLVCADGVLQGEGEDVWVGKENQKMKGRQLSLAECQEMMGVSKCEDCEVYRECCDYGAEKRAEKGETI